MKNQKFTPAQKKVLIKLLKKEHHSTCYSTDNYKSVDKLIEMGILKMTNNGFFDFRLPQMRNWFEGWANEIKQ